MDPKREVEKNRIKGIIPPVITPMNADESINYSELRNQVRRLVEAGVHGIFACGTNGEGYALSAKEKQSVIETIVDEVDGMIPVYAGTGTITTRETIEQSKMAIDLGADILSVITPYFAKASQDELYDHYAELAFSVEAPIILYNIPARTGNTLAPATVRRLACDFDNIVGVKDSSGNFDNLKQYIELTTDIDGFAVLSGNDSLILPSLVFGGKGGIAGCANVFPHTLVSIYEYFITGEFDKAVIAQDSIRQFRNCFSFGNPNTIVKAAVEMLGFEVGSCRKPFSFISHECRAAIAAVLESCRKNGLS